MHPLLDPASSLRPVVGHRGNRAHAPENTVESFLQAVAVGVDALEMDVHLTADGEVVVIHDATVDRTTDGRGRVDAMTLAQLRALDAGARFTTDGGRTLPYRGQGIGISTFAEVLERVPATMPLLIEIKTARASARLREVIEAAGAESRCIVESFDPAAAAPFAGSSIEVGASQDQVARLLVPALLGRAPPSLPYRFMAIPRWFHGIPVPIGALVRAAGSANALVHVWTVNEPAVARALWAVGVRAIITDDPATILAERRRLEARG
jgi:glycerophosphoryl diester phosphodiesterase